MCHGRTSEFPEPALFLLDRSRIGRLPCRDDGRVTVAFRKRPGILWVMPKRLSKPPDVNQIAAQIVAAVERGEGPKTDDGKNPFAVALGRRGGLKGGKARAASLTSEQRSEIAKRAAQTRWRSK